MARMVDVGGKKDVKRKAVATGEIVLKPATLTAIKAGQIAKGDTLAAAEVAALQAIKKVWEVLPHTHQIPITSAGVNLKVGDGAVSATVTVEATYKTGVEMEALYGVSVALLTVWDMVKSLEKDENGQYPGTRIREIRLVSKVKGDG
jgi:cyclic pyranopterin phosphate synthase